MGVRWGSQVAPHSEESELPWPLRPSVPTSHDVLVNSLSYIICNKSKGRKRRQRLFVPRGLENKKEAVSRAIGIQCRSFDMTSYSKANAFPRTNHSTIILCKNSFAFIVGKRWKWKPSVMNIYCIQCFTSGHPVLRSGDPVSMDGCKYTQPDEAKVLSYMSVSLRGRAFPGD